MKNTLSEFRDFADKWKLWGAILVIFLTGAALANATWMTYANYREVRAVEVYESYVERLGNAHSAAMDDMRDRISYKIDKVLELLDDETRPEVIQAKQELLRAKESSL